MASVIALQVALIRPGSVTAVVLMLARAAREAKGSCVFTVPLVKGDQLKFDAENRNANKIISV